MEVNALREIITNLDYIRNLIETSDYNLGFQERMDKFIQCLDRFEYDTSAIIAEITTNNILYEKPKNMELYYKQLYRIIRDQKQYIKSLTDFPNYEMRTDSEINMAVIRYISYAEKFVLKMTALLPNDIEDKVQDETPENVHSLNSVPSKLLFLKYSSLATSLIDDIETGKTTKAKISRILSYLLNTKASNVQSLMGNFSHFNINNTENTPYKIKYVEPALRALKDAQIDAPELREIYSQLLRLSEK